MSYRDRILAYVDRQDAVYRQIALDIHAKPEVSNYEFFACETLSGQLAKEGFDPVYGARPLRRAIVNKSEEMLSEAILQGNIAKGDSVTVVYDGAYTYTKEAKQ